MTIVIKLFNTIKNYKATTHSYSLPFNQDSKMFLFPVTLTFYYIHEVEGN